MQIMNAALQLAHAKQAGSTASPQLRQAANQFEASFLQELLKPMTEDSMFGSEDGSPTGSMGTVSSMATQALADGIAKNGGLGIAKRVLAELAPVEAAQSGKTGTTAGAKCGGCAPRLPSLTKTSLSAATALQSNISQQDANEEDLALPAPSTGQNLSKMFILPGEML